MQGVLDQQLKRAEQDHLEVDLITPDSRIFAGIVVESHADGYITGTDYEGATLVLSEDRVSGAIVKDRTPSWYQGAATR